MSAAAAAVSIARRYLFNKFKEHNAYSRENAISYDKLELNHRKYRMAQRLFTNYQSKNVIKEYNGRYWLDKQALDNYNYNAMKIVLLICG